MMISQISSIVSPEIMKTQIMLMGRGIKSLTLNH